jgi:hypothetical protein
MQDRDAFRVELSIEQKEDSRGVKVVFNVVLEVVEDCDFLVVESGAL